MSSASHYLVIVAIVASFAGGIAIGRSVEASPPTGAEFEIRRLPDPEMQERWLLAPKPVRIVSERRRMPEFDEGSLLPVTTALRPAWLTWFVVGWLLTFLFSANERLSQIKDLAPDFRGITASGLLMILIFGLSVPLLYLVKAVRNDLVWMSQMFGRDDHSRPE